LTRRKTLDRKIQEALVGWRMRRVVSKDRVLELYLNCIEYGEDVYGIGPAARHYFQKPASELTPLEAVFLAVLKPAPWQGDEFLEEGSTPRSGWWHDRTTEIMERLVQKGFLSEKRAEDAKPYVLRWDDTGNYLPDEPASLEGDESGDASSGDESELGESE
jgi:membrane peptidoglycan carboxypeptidase